jgi:hypothetical protein
MSSLLKERNDFLKRASALPAVERRTQPAAKRQKVAPSPKVTGSRVSGQKNFAVIHKIVNHMKGLHLSSETRQLTLAEILEECHSQTLGTVMTHTMTSSTVLVTMTSSVCILLISDFESTSKYRRSAKIKSKNEMS